jgi:hypothetical protein
MPDHITGRPALGRTTSQLNLPTPTASPAGQHAAPTPQLIIRTPDALPACPSRSATTSQLNLPLHLLAPRAVPRHGSMSRCLPLHLLAPRAAPRHGSMSSCLTASSAAPALPHHRRRCLTLPCRPAQGPRDSSISRPLPLHLQPSTLPPRHSPMSRLLHRCAKLHHVPAQPGGHGHLRSSELS